MRPRVWWDALTPVERLRVLVLGGGAGVLLLFVIFLVWAAPDGRLTSAEGAHCAQGRAPAAAVLILLDYTDALSPSQVRAVKQEVNRVLEDARASELVSIAAIRNLPVEFKISLCSPDPGGTPSVWHQLSHPYENWILIRANWQQAFEVPMLAAERQLTLNCVAPRSPILQSIDDATDQLGGAWRKAGQRRLVIFSDMMENTDKFSHYGKQNVLQNYESVASRVDYVRRTHPALRGAEVSVYYLLIPGDVPYQDGYSREAHQRFWKDYFAQNGANRISFTDLAFGPSSREVANVRHC